MIDTKEIELQISNSTDPVQKLMLENRLAWHHSLTQPSKAIELALKNRQTALVLNNNNEVGFALMALANAYLQLSDYDNTFKYAYESNEILRSTGNKRGEARSLNIIGNAFFLLGNYEESLKCRFESLGLYEVIGNEDGKVSNLLNLGNIHAVMKDLPQALNYYSTALEYLKKRNDRHELRATYMNMGSAFALQKNYDKALEYYAFSSQVQADHPDQVEVNLNNNLAQVYFLKGDFEKAKQYHDLALILSKRISFKLGEATALLGLSKVEGARGSLSESVKLADAALGLFKGAKLNDGITEGLLHISDMYEKLGKHAEALAAFKEYNSVIAEINNVESERKTKNMLMLHQVDELKKDADAQRVMNVELKKANREIEVINKDLLASISYAKHVQDSILPNENSLKHFFPESFLFMRPKDIISGDFLWVYEKEDEILVACIDCTGHGVPGAFMSIVANSLLNQVAMNQWLTSPAFLLNELNFLVERSLTTKDESIVARDGMDLSLCSFNKSKSEIVFAGAHCVVYVISEGKISEFKGDKISIGNTNTVSFNNTKITVKKDDSVYMFTDGYIDQRGGPERKKFYYDPFKKLLLSLHELPMPEQKKKIEQNMSQWMGEEKQLDDMQVIGIRV